MPNEGENPVLIVAFWGLDDLEFIRKRIFHEIITDTVLFYCKKVMFFERKLKFFTFYQK